MPYPGIPEKDVGIIDECVNQLMNDKNFKPKDSKQPKKQAAIAVCMARYKQGLMKSKRTSKKKAAKKVAYEEVYQTYTASELDPQPVDQIKIVPQGKYDTTKYGEVEITEEDIEAMVDNFDNRHGVPVDIDHKNEEAVGWITALFNKGKEGLWGTVEWTKRGLELVKDKAYKGLSPEFALEYTDPESSEKQDATLIAVSLTNFPLFQKALKQSLLAKKQSKKLLTLKPMPFSKVRKLKFDELDDTKKALIQENWDKLSSEEQARFADLKPKVKEEPKKIEIEKPEPKPAPKVEAEPAKVKVEVEVKKEENEPKKEETPSKEEVPVEPAKEEKAAPEPEPEKAPEPPAKEENVEPAKQEEEVVEEKVEEKPAESPKEEAPKEEAVNMPVEKKVEAREEIDNRIKAAEERAQKAEREIIRMKVEQEVTTNLLFNSKGGKFAPKAKDDLIDLIMSMNKSQLQKFNRVINAIPGKKILGEIGSSEQTPLNKQKQLDKLISEKISANNKMDYTQAFVEAAKENPDLFKE